MGIIGNTLKLSLSVFCILPLIVNHLVVLIDRNHGLQAALGLLPSESSPMTGYFLSLIDDGTQ